MSASSSDLFLMGLLSVTDALLDRPINEVLSYLPSPPMFASHCAAPIASAVFTTRSSPTNAPDWPALSSIAARLGQVEDQVPACYVVAATRASSLATT
jgi:c-di-GMP-related signal transduction protein